MGIASLVLGIASLVCGSFLPGLQWIGLFNHRFCAVYNFLRSLRSLRIDRVKSSQWSQLIPTAKYW